MSSVSCKKTAEVAADSDKSAQSVEITSKTTTTVSAAQPAAAAAATISTQGDIKGQELMLEPLALEYATSSAVPQHLRQLLEQHAKGKTSSVELLVMLIYCVALESGFVANETFDQKRHLLKPVPAVGCFHICNVRLLSQQPLLFTKEFEDTVHRLQLRTLVHLGSDEAAAVATLQSRLMAVVLGDLLMVTLSPVPPSKEPGFSVCLSIGRYVLNVQLEPVEQRFRRLDELCLQLRQKLFQPMRAQQLLSLKLQMHPTLLGLPEELYDEIFRHLNSNQLNIVANVNWQLCTTSKQFKDRRRQTKL